MPYTGREDRRGDDRRGTPRDGGFKRRIDCAEDGSSRSASPARGGGRREAESWAARPRDHRG